MKTWKNALILKIGKINLQILSRTVHLNKKPRPKWSEVFSAKGTAIRGFFSLGKECENGHSARFRLEL